MRSFGLRSSKPSAPQTSTITTEYRWLVWNAGMKPGWLFSDGLRQQPRRQTFSLELAGVCFKQKNYAEAAGYLRRALRLDPEDTYANDFLASVYFLQGNLEAALTCWNRVSKPLIEEMPLDPTPRVDPALLDHAFAFAPATVLSLHDLQTTQARVDGLNIFSNYRFDLEARPDGKFDMVFRAQERNGASPDGEGLLALFRGLPFKTIHPEFFNIRRRAINFESLIRWDPEKRRLRTNLSGLSSETRSGDIHSIWICATKTGTSAVPLPVWRRRWAG